MLTYNLTHVKNDDGTLETDSNTSDDTTTDNYTKSTSPNTSKHLNDNTDDVDKAASNNSPFAANSVGDIASNDSAKEGTSGENRNDQRLVRRLEGLGTGKFDEVNKLLGAIDTVDVSRIITEEDTTKGGESAKEVCLESDLNRNLLLASALEVT